jgi:hypothetical protein
MSLSRLNPTRWKAVRNSLTLSEEGIKRGERNISPLKPKDRGGMINEKGTKSNNDQSIPFNLVVIYGCQPRFWGRL